jgi:hypothetical protein
LAPRLWLDPLPLKIFGNTKHRRVQTISGIRQKDPQPNSNIDRDTIIVSAHQLQHTRPRSVVINAATSNAQIRTFFCGAESIIVKISIPRIRHGTHLSIALSPNRPMAMSRSMTGLIGLIDRQLIDTTLKAEPLLSF